MLLTDLAACLMVINIILFMSTVLLFYVFGLLWLFKFSTKLTATRQANTYAHLENYVTAFFLRALRFAAADNDASEDEEDDAVDVSFVDEMVAAVAVVVGALRAAIAAIAAFDSSSARAALACSGEGTLGSGSPTCHNRTGHTVVLATSARTSL
jgi:hypothetical protein